MKIAMVGTGYVGLVTGTCFAEMGNDVICVDVNQDKVDKLRQGIIPIYEPGLAELVQANQKRNTLSFTTEIREALQEASICFIAVGTPMGEDGSADLNYVMSVAGDIGRYMVHPMIVVNKSTVPVGTAEKVRQIIKEELDKREVNYDFDVVSNPEFLREGNACNDFMKPDRVIVGVDHPLALEVMVELYRPFLLSEDTFITMDVKSAELTKYAANSMLATKISFINEIANICELVGADINKVRKGIGSDHRIGYQCIFPGCGYGGSCFPKDVQALIKTGAEFGYTAKVLQAVEEVNQYQKIILVNKVIRVFGENLFGKIFAIWGLSFKPETDDMREATSIIVIKALLKLGAKLKVYDPKAMELAHNYYLKDVKGIEYMQSKYDALNDVEAMLLLTEWMEFRSPDFEEMYKRMKCKYIFDGRNQYTKSMMKRYGFIYEQIGVKRNG